MVDFAKQDDVQKWLDMIGPEERRREVAIVIAARAALRVLPLLATYQQMLQKEPRLMEFVLPTFRAAALPWVAARFPSRGPAVLAAIVPTVCADGIVVGGATDTARYANTAAFAATLTLSLSAAYVARAAETVVAAHASAASAGLATEFNASASADVTWVSDSRSSVELAGTPLWLGSLSGPAISFWQKFKRMMIDSHLDWHVWTEWYDARFFGAPANEDLEIARALIANEIWDQGPRAVNAEIARLIDLHTPKPPLIDVIPEQNRTGTRFGVDATGRIDMMRTPPTADDLQRLHYEEMRYKAIEFVALG